MSNKLSDKIGKALGIGVAAIYIGAFGLFILWIAYMALTKGVPAVIASVTHWWDDTTTAVAEHHWQATDAMLYGGIVLILAIRFRNTLGRVLDYLGLD